MDLKFFFLCVLCVMPVVTHTVRTGARALRTTTTGSATTATGVGGGC